MVAALVAGVPGRVLHLLPELLVLDELARRLHGPEQR